MTPENFESREQEFMEKARERWSELMNRLGAKDGGERVFGDLVAWHREEHRKYHDFSHPAAMVEEFQSLKNLAENPDAIELAIWFHDAVYDPKSNDNEPQSARTAMEAAERLGFSEDLAKDVRSLIIATEHKRTPEKIDDQIIVDLDLAPLAADPEVFDANTDKIRAEYSWASDKDFKRTRIEFLEAMLARLHIFSTPVMREKYEAKARANLERSIKELSK